ncbi:MULTISPECIES: hypothetical protein [unclassified Pseudovibrio]|uniref:hypothetical protein n=1 Tax=unclassified Pseudovibrio TaxID=2627060 RepID=UPI0007AE918D|nr:MULTISPECIES: hypothetical protein [unclassified Pseudovibrio]KZK96626.1 hypothetical protein PsW74_03855 [Pseudovibrio sp. W74]KZL03217.1 hypothetical protein PsAD14_05747 [Pseudovibrio sp. Ad14]
MRSNLQWVRLPTSWLSEDDCYSAFNKKVMADNTMALLCLLVIAHNADEDTGLARVTYDQFQEALSKSRSSISRGLAVLKRLQLVSMTGERSHYQLVGYRQNKGWAKLPCKKLYKGKSLTVSNSIHLRSIVELDALKIYFLLVAARDRKTNYAALSYMKIEARTGIARPRIKAATSFLAAQNLVVIDAVSSTLHDAAVSYRYRLTGLDPYNHSGTKGRQSIEEVTYDDDF